MVAVGQKPSWDHVCSNSVSEGFCILHGCLILGGRQMGLNKSVIRLEQVVAKVDVQLATMGEHLKAINNRLESGTKRFEVQESDLKRVVQMHHDQQKEIAKLVSNQRLFMLVITGGGTLIGVVATAWINHVLGLVVNG